MSSAGGRRPSDERLPERRAEGSCTADGGLDDGSPARRRILHGYIDILKSELLARKKAAYTGEGGALDNIDIEHLSRILAGKGLPEDGGQS